MVTGVALRRARGAAQPPVLDRRRREFGAAPRWPVGSRASCPCSPGCRFLRRHVGVRLAELDAQRRAGRVAVGVWPLPWHLGAALLITRRCRLSARRSARREYRRGRLAAARLPDYLVQSARHLARGARPARELALLDRHRCGAGVPFLQAGLDANGAVEPAVHCHRDRRLHRVAPALAGAGRRRCPHDRRRRCCSTCRAVKTASRRSRRR